MSSKLSVCVHRTTSALKASLKHGRTVWLPQPCERWKRDKPAYDMPGDTVSQTSACWPRTPLSYVTYIRPVSQGSRQVPCVRPPKNWQIQHRFADSIRKVRHCMPQKLTSLSSNTDTDERLTSTDLCPIMRLVPAHAHARHTLMLL